MERTLSSLADFQHTYTSTSDLRVFDVSRYYHLYQEAVQKLGSNGARNVVRTSLINDGVGLITEKISSEKENGNFIFDTESRVRLQLTPPQHTYIKARYSQTTEPYMTAPEYLFLEKDVLSTFSDWRRSLDRTAMTEVRNQFLNSQDENVLFWGSLKAEDWEDPLIQKYNGSYGYAYMAKIYGEGEARRMVVYDFKMDLQRDAFNIFLKKVGTEFFIDKESEIKPDLDRSMTTIAKTKYDFNVGEVWRLLGEAKNEAGKDNKIFNLSADTIQAVQDKRLHQLIKEFAAPSVAEWILSRIESGQSPDELQAKVRQEYINATKEALSMYWLEKNREVELLGGRRYQESFIGAELMVYSGSNGDFCGDWGQRQLLSKGRSFTNYSGLERRNILPFINGGSVYDVVDISHPELVWRIGDCTNGCGKKSVEVAQCNICRECQTRYDEAARMVKIKERMEKIFR